MLTRSHLAALAEQLGQVLGDVEAGNVEAEPWERAYMQGALAAAQVIARQVDDDPANAA